MSKWLRTLPVALVLLGIAVCFYILEAKAHGGLACPIGGCEKVQSSVYSHIGSLQLPVLGLLAYLCLAFALLASGVKARMVELAIASAGAFFSLYLIAIQLFVLQAICMWCAVSDLGMVLFACLSLLRLQAEMRTEAS